MNKEPELTKEQQFKRNQILAQIIQLNDSLELSRIGQIELSQTQEAAIEERLQSHR